MFNPSRLTIARQRAGLTKKELSNYVGVDPRSISGFELGEYEPSAETLLSLAKVLEFPASFFECDEIEIISSEAVSFRSLSKMTSKQRDAAVAAGSIALLLNDWVDREFELPSVDLPDFAGMDPETAAYSLRQLWSLGERPIKNIVHLLESKGVRVFSLVEDCESVDAYSVWRGSRPFVFLNTMKSGERRRFDAAHELAHLILHQNVGSQGPDAEKEAQQFASAFLMPEAAIRAHGYIAPSMKVLMEIKKKWMVSIAALTVRLYGLKIFTYYNYNRLMIEISKSGFRRTEPEGMRPETSQVWAKIVAQLREEGLGIASIASELSLPANEIQKLVFGLVTVAVPSSGKIASRPSKAHLTVIK